MNWKTEAIDKLNQYEAKRKALDSIPYEIIRLEKDACKIRSASFDGTPVKGGGNRREDVLLNNIVLRQELEENLEEVKLWLDNVENALSVLNSEEQQILDRFYMNPEKDAANRLAGDLFMDVKTVYRRKDAALRKFTIALYGAEIS